MTADHRKSTAPASASGTGAAKRPSRKRATKKSPAAKDTSEKVSESNSGEDETSSKASAPRAESRPRLPAAEVAHRALEQLADLTGKSTEGVTGIERTDDGWRVTAEVVEVRRVPETTDVLAQYEIDTDEKGSLMGYRRARRYTRGSAQEG